MKRGQNEKPEGGGLQGLVLSSSPFPSPRPSPRGEGEFSPVGRRIVTLGGYASRAQRFSLPEAEGERDGGVCLNCTNPAKGHNVLSEDADSVRSDPSLESTRSEFFLFFSGAARDWTPGFVMCRAAEEQSILWVRWSINRPPLTGLGSARAGLRSERGEEGWAGNTAGDSGVVPSFLEAGS
jgi:hypothetical protein